MTPVWFACLVAWLAVCALLAVAAVRTKRPPTGDLPDVAGYLRDWSALHGGYEPDRSRLVGGWLALTYRVGRPLARRGVQPWTLTAAGVLASAGAVLAASAGGHWPLLAAAAVIAVGLLDGLDGCVAVLTGRTSRFGAVLDAVADRLTDIAFLAALWLAGGAGGGLACLVVAAAAATILLEYARARAGAAGMIEVGVVTWGERPTRLVMVVLGLVAAGLVPGAAGLSAVVVAAALAGVALVGLGQFLLVARHALASQSTVRDPRASAGSGVDRR